MLTLILCACGADEPPLPTTMIVEMPPPAAGQLQPDLDRPMYWRYRGKPVFPLGGSIEDNLFQIPDLDAHLDLLVSVGGNYVRNTMSPRDVGNVMPHYYDEATGKYDLERWSDEYWRRFDHFLEATAARGVIVQFEVWDRFDLAREPWLKSSFNPANNVNYTTADTGMEHVYDIHPGRFKHPFFRTPPALDDNPMLLRHQQRFVDRMLDSALKYDHLLYCIDNETTVPPEWGEYWATYIQKRAAAEGRHVYCTEMWDAHVLSDPQHRRTTDRPDLYRFVDASQNNHMNGDAHYELLFRFRERIAGSNMPRPINNVKVYGADGGPFNDTHQGVTRFWRNMLAGAATTRFHRPPHGLGLSDTAQTHIRSARMFVEAFDIFATEPTWGVFTRDRQPEQAYCLHKPGDTYALFLPRGGQVTIEVGGGPGWTVRWLDIAASQWRDEQAQQSSSGRLTLTAPGAGYWAVVVTAAK